MTNTNQPSTEAGLEAQAPSQILETLLAGKYPNLRRAQRAQAEATALAQEASGSQAFAFSIQEDPRTGVYRLRQVPTAGAPAEPKESNPNSAPVQNPVRLKATATTTSKAATGGKAQGTAASKKS
jgi:hypothetical protein